MFCPPGKPRTSPCEDNDRHLIKAEEGNDPEGYVEEEEDPYNVCPDDIYDTVDVDSAYTSGVLNRPPAPVPRSETETSEPEKPTSTYISRGMRSSISSLHVGFRETVLWSDLSLSDSVFR